MRNEEIHEDDTESDLDAGGDESGLHFLDAAEKSLDAIRDSGHEIEYRHYFQVVCADLRHSTAPEQTDDRIPEEKDHKTDEYAVAKFQDHAFSESFPHLISVPGTVALTCIIHDGMADALLRNACKIINPVYSIEGGNNADSVTVDASLDQQFANGLHQLLESSNRAILEDKLHNIFIWSPFVPLQGKYRYISVNVDQAQDTGDCFGKQCGGACSGYGKVELADKYDIQDYINDAGNPQE